MDKKGLLSKLIAVFNSEQLVSNFIDIKTLDGRILRVEDMAVDKAVKEITEEGEIDLENGEYTLENGVIIKVEDGLIKEISEEEETEIEEVETVEEEMSSETEVETEVDFEVDTLISNIKNMIDEITSLKSEFKSLKLENEGLKLEVEKFSKSPSTEPTKLKVDFKKESKGIMYDILTNKK